MITAIAIVFSFSTGMIIAAARAEHIAREAERIARQVEAIGRQERVTVQADGRIA